MKRKLTLKEIPADLETPVTAFLKLRAAGARTLLESVEQAELMGRYSFIGLDTLQDIRIVPGYVILESAGRTEVLDLEGRNPLEIVRERLPESPDLPDGLPGLVAGAVGYIGYDYVRMLEKLPETLEDPLGLPVAHLTTPGTTAIFDHVKRKIIIVASGEDCERRIEEVIETLRSPLPRAIIAPAPSGKRTVFTSNTSEEKYCEIVRNAKEYIRAGDIFQVVLSRREEGEIHVHPFQIYRALRILNPSTYMFFLDFGDYQLIGSSPEVHAKLTGRTALMRPIAGTRPRGATPDEDRALEKELLADEKERAEHLMLIDLARNDVGRVADYGTVRCSDLFVIERYSHVMHIVSQVHGRLADGKDQFDLLANTFPAGTVSGAPKIRAMQIIEELEHSRRGPYAGTVGYFTPGGDTDMCITIRTILVKGRTAYLQGGAGIVADSDPAREWKETESKIAALKGAVLMAEEGL
ncbi:MAG: anthranilate synthase component I [Planctomycetota bacterium]|jgi:anthranilate synthase component 1